MEEAAKRRLQDEALDGAIADYEAELGIISDEELDNSRLAAALDSRFGPGGKGKRRSRRSA